MDIQHLYSDYIDRAQQALEALGLMDSVVQQDTVCLQIPSHERYDQVKAQLIEEDARLLSEKEIGGRLIAVFAPAAPVRAEGSPWAASFVELAQPKPNADSVPEGIRHVQFVVRTGVETFREAHEHIRFRDRGNYANRLLETKREDVTLRFHDKHLGAVIEQEKAAAILPPVEFAVPGPMREALVRVVESGEKTATTSLLAEYQVFGEALPSVGDRGVVVDSDSQPACVIEVTDVQVVPLKDVPRSHVVAEGEGFENPAEWRAAHKEFWDSEEVREHLGPDLKISDSTLVVLERFRTLP
ncbi:VOC family protein [Nesterenkonia populi]